MSTATPTGPAALRGALRFLLRFLLRLPQRALIGCVQFYRLFLSAWLGSQCRFEPTCSRYALQALEQHGAAAGSYLAARRILRCSPWCPGGCDPVPPAFTFLSSRFSSRPTSKP